MAIQLRQKLFQNGELYQIVKVGSTMQMCVGRLSADGQYGVIVSTSLAQITTAAEVLRSILGPVALILLVLDLLYLGCVQKNVLQSQQALEKTRALIHELRNE